ncbi:MAG: hypothetical protein PHF35_04060 [Candidatus Moranbacteria bacterium]|nr:hypothetical protein [Candidatus Moranbacteria bacterium]
MPAAVPTKYAMQYETSVAVDPSGAPPPNGGAGLPKAEGDSPTIAARQKSARPAPVRTE